MRLYLLQTYTSQTYTVEVIEYSIIQYTSKPRLFKLSLATLHNYTYDYDVQSMCVCVRAFVSDFINTVFIITVITPVQCE